MTKTGLLNALGINDIDKREGIMEKVWLKNYPPGVSPTIDLDGQTIVDYISKQCDSYPQACAFENFKSEITYAEFDEKSKRLAAYFQKELGLKKGDRFGIMLPNILQFPIAMFAALRAGLTIVTINPLYTSREISHQLKDAGVTAIIVLEKFAHELANALPYVSTKHVIVTRIGDCLGTVKGTVFNFVLKYIKRDVPDWHIPRAMIFNRVMEKAKELTFDPVAIDKSDVAFFQYTGGTTGTPKGAILTHKNIVANVKQCLAWVKNDLEPEKEAVITALPLYHIFSLTGCMFFMGIGVKALLITNPRDIKLFIRLLKSYQFSVFMGLNTLFNALMHAPGFEKINFSSFKLCFSGGMALQKTVADEWKEKTGLKITEGYGLTEASPVVCINPLHLKDHIGSVGLPIPSTEVKVCDAEGNELPQGEKGELYVRGPQVMKGYWRCPNETALVLDDKGWLRTGDVARLDEKGFIYIVDRKKDMIIVSGFNVYPNEVEAVIMSHPGVGEVAVVGVPSERSGEAVKAVIVKRDRRLTADDVLDFCHKHLTGYKVPSYIQFKRDLPKSTVGKVLRRALR
jgi:long-chain acyl-CoA synthetase